MKLIVKFSSMCIDYVVKAAAAIICILLKFIEYF